MKLDQFNYHLPDEYIAQEPVYPRDHSKLLIYDKNNGNISESKFYEMQNYLWSNDVLVINNTKVFPARLFWEIDIYRVKQRLTKPIEIFLHKQISENTWECLWPGNNLKPGREIRFLDKDNKIFLKWIVKEISNMWRMIEFNIWWIDFFELLEEIWEMPLPPYITQKLKDKNNYQTVYAKNIWSAAAPTAWLHFTEELITNLKNKWVIIEEVLLHVGVWTFKWVEVDDIKSHYMHTEYIQISQEVASRLNEYKKQWKNIIAVGTTSVRVLESFANETGELDFWEKETNIFIYPGYNWKFVQSIITNFHLPKSTLFMLVCALIWIDTTQYIYNFAIQNKYRFFSFGDAMRIK